MEVVSCQPSPLHPEWQSFYFIQQNLETSEIEVYGIPMYHMELLEQLMWIMDLFVYGYDAFWPTLSTPSRF